jgi:tetratricopeptide (TPR) repeat protein
LLDVAIWFLEQARQKNPKDSKVNRALARLYERRGNFGQAIVLWELVRKAHPHDAEARDKAKDLAASDTIARGGYEAVVGSPGAEGEAAPRKERPGLKPVAGTAAMSRTDQEAAAVWARIEKDPTQPNGYLQLAGIYRKAGQLEQAKTALEKGLGPTGNHFDLASELAELEIEPFRRNLALVEAKLNASPGNEEHRLLRIRLLKEINTRELDLFRQKSERFPTHKGYRFEHGLRLLRAGQVDEAIQELQAVRSDPRYQWRALLYLGHSFKGRNNWKLAERNFEEALRALPPSEEAARKDLLFQLAQGNAEAGELNRAVEFGLELANLDFGYNNIGRLLDEWQARLQQTRISG